VAHDNTKPEVQVPAGETPSYQLELEDITVGDGDEAVAGKVVEVHYVGVSWKDGRQFDASWDSGETFKFGLGRGQVISGWDQGVAGMKVGADARLRQARRRRRDRARRDARVRRGPDRRRLSRRSKRRPGPADFPAAGRGGLRHYFLISGPAAARTCFIVNGLSNAPFGVIFEPVRTAIDAA